MVNLIELMMFSEYCMSEYLRERSDVNTRFLSASARNFCIGWDPRKWEGTNANNFSVTCSRTVPEYFHTVVGITCNFVIGDHNILTRAVVLQAYINYYLLK